MHSSALFEITKHEMKDKFLMHRLDNQPIYFAYDSYFYMYW